MSAQEKPQKKGGIFGWVAELSHDNKEKERHAHQHQQHVHQQSMTANTPGQNQNGWDLTRIMGRHLSMRCPLSCLCYRCAGFVTATASEDWTLVLEVCERASASESGAREAARALRSEFKYVFIFC